MANDRRASQQRRKLSRAELKAYESRRAAERRRLAIQTATSQGEDGAPIEHSYSITRDDEYGVIKSDLVRLGWIVGILFVLLAIATVFLA